MRGRGDRAVRSQRARHFLVGLAAGLVALSSSAAPLALQSSRAAAASWPGPYSLLDQPLSQDLRGAAEVVGTDGDGLRVRQAADPSAEVLAILDEGTGVEIVEGPVDAGGLAWYRVRYAGGGVGWAAGRYLRARAGRTDRAALLDSLMAETAPSRSPVPSVSRGGLPGAPAGSSVVAAAERLPGREREPAAVAHAGLITPASISSAIGAPLRPLPPVEARDPRFGLVEAFRLADTGLDRALGARYQRLTFWWRGLQPTPGAPLNPFYFPADLMDHELHQGYELVGVILNTPDWAAANPADGPRSVPANLYLEWDDPRNHWGRFAERLAREYAGRVNDWVIWNEPDIQPDDPNAAHYVFAGSLDDYYQLLRVGYRSIKRGNPAARVHLAGLTYWVDRRANRPQYFERLLDRILADPSAAAHQHYFDRVTLHLYTDPRALYRVPRLYRELMQARGLDKPIWINETNVIPWDEPLHRGTGYEVASGMRCTLADQASYLLQAFALGLAGGAERIGVYKAEDGHGAAFNPHVDGVERAALVREDGTLRPAFLAYQTAVRHLGGATQARYFASPSVEAVALDRPGGQRTTVIWNAAPFPVVAVLARSGGSASLVDALGRSQALSGEPAEFAIALPAATCNTDPDDPPRYLMGGETYLLVESGVPAERIPVAPRPERLSAQALGVTP